jgi:lysophospholipase L1-like esterase
MRNWIFRFFLISTLLVILTPAPAKAIVNVMPFGDSLTAGGYNLSDGYHTASGYRETLDSLLSEAGFKVQFVGSYQDGAFANNHHEGHSGKRIDEVSAGAEQWVSAAKPDIVLLLIGTNDCIQNDDLPNAMNRLSDLIANIRLGAPNSVIFISTTVPNATPDTEARVLSYNNNLANFVQTRMQTDSKIHFVDMYKLANLQITDLIDGVHPTPTGYSVMGQVWFNVLSAYLKQP